MARLARSHFHYDRNMGRRVIGGAMIAVSAMASLAYAADGARGRLLYETRCGSCHETSVHGRTKRIATTCESVRAQVMRWNDNQRAGWSADEIDDVTLWLNERYYKFPVENGRCVTPLANFPAGARA